MPFLDPDRLGDLRCPDFKAFGLRLRVEPVQDQGIGLLKGVELAGGQFPRSAVPIDLIIPLENVITRPGCSSML